MASANGAKSAKFCGIPPKSGTEASKKDSCIQCSSNFEKQWSEIKKSQLVLKLWISVKTVQIIMNYLYGQRTVNTLNKYLFIFQIVIFSMSETRG